MFKASCGATEYQRQGKGFVFPNLCGELCPHCRSDYLRAHGYYSRYLILEDFSGEILVRRYICKECRRTVSLLPSFAHPGRAYGTKLVVDVLYNYYAMGKRICDIAADSVCSRQLFRWFRIRIVQNLNMLAMGLTNALCLRGPPLGAVAEKTRVGQFFSYIRSYDTEDISLKIFGHSRRTYLTPLSR